MDTDKVNFSEDDKGYDEDHEKANDFDNTKVDNTNQSREKYIGKIKNYIEKDKIMSPAWIFVQLTLAFAGSLFLFMLKDFKRVTSTYGVYNLRTIQIQSIGLSTHSETIMNGVAIILLLLADVVSLYIIVSLISRRNNHLERTRNLYLVLADYIEYIGPTETKHMEKYNSMKAWKIRELAKRCEVETGKKNVVGWAILSIIPVVNIFAIPYIYHFLTRDFFRHDRYEKLILDVLSECLKADTKTSDIGNYPDRDTVMYFLLNFVTFGLLGIYWLYTLFVDPNKHFKEHTLIEEEILRVL